MYEEELGRGGFGVVCRVRHNFDNVEYALKIVRLCDRYVTLSQWHGAYKAQTREIGL